MSILDALTDKPWLSPGIGARAEVTEDVERRAADAGVFLGVFLGVVAALFALLASAYLMRMGVHGPIGHGAADWARLAEPPLLWVNTAVLVLSSVALHAATVAARKGDGRALTTWFLVGGLLAVVFLAGQITVWRQLDTAGHFLALHSVICTAVDNPFAPPPGPLISGNPAVAFFYLITALHGLHILGGLVAWARTSVRVLRGASAAAIAPSVRLCARYWHFLLLVWFVMFGLLLMT
ncbi:cytochrome c oxidase subunit 3 [Sphingomonas cavernae]|uniref:Heme-copper oxidase subunit III family profile domain-containing protein n=1 Tax=Sphingomonas cavernae TaxID=2320861 RepID=A0A418W747_9SPHN|nr:hypothetical protein [Sphingomonas cavernae]RJF85787.1 hypothetical protein D3876_18090 [Sphingomonas cavernae]